MSWELAGRPLNRILVTRLRYLGDVVMSTVVLAALRRGDPELRIGYLCEQGHGDVLKDHPLIDHLHLLRTQRRGADARARVSLPEQATIGPTPRGGPGTILDLRRQDYDLAVDLFFNPRSAWLLRLAGIGLRICGTDRSRRRLYTHAIPGSPTGELARALDRSVSGVLAMHLGRLAPLVHRPSGLDFGAWFGEAFGDIPLQPKIRRPAPTPRTIAALHQVGVEAERPYLLLAPGATWPSKTWPLASWSDLIARVVSETSLPMVILCAPGQAETWRPLAASIPAGRGGFLEPLPLPEVLSLVGAGRALVTVDGGVMHAAVGMGIPTLALFGATDPDAWFPYERCGPFRVLATRPDCHPCDLHHCEQFVCLPDLDAATVSAELADLLNRSASPQDVDGHDT